MKILILLLSLFTCTSFSLAQADSNETQVDSVSHGIRATYPGGEQALQRHIAEHFRYPEEALMNDVAGTVYLTFVIDTFGNITDLQADTVHYSTVFLKSKSKKKQEKRRLYIEKLIREDKDYGLRQAAKESLDGCLKWIPAEQDGVKVKMRYRIPIKFYLY